MREKWLAVAREGVVAGLIGYLVVAVVMGATSMMNGHSPFYPAALLGASFFYGVQDAAQIVVRPEYVFAYNGAHLMVFLGFGLIGAWLAQFADRGEQLWYPTLFFFLLVAFHLVGAAQVAAVPVRESLPASGIWIAGFLASIAMAGFFLARHPLLRVREAW